MVAWERWEPVYEEVLTAFGFPREADEAARDELAALVAERAAPPVPDSRLRVLFDGREVTVYGPALDALQDWHYEPRSDVKVATDPVTRDLLDHEVVPDVIVTDLDGDVWAQVDANRRGAIAVVHAHGDNRRALAEWVPRFHGPLVATTQAAPVPHVRNFGGFTDGDRAVYLADHFQARRVTLIGFDFLRPVEKEGRDARVKREKLRWAHALIKNVTVPVRVPTEGGPFSF